MLVYLLSSALILFCVARTLYSHISALNTTIHQSQNWSNISLSWPKWMLILYQLVFSSYPFFLLFKKKNLKASNHGTTSTFNIMQSKAKSWVLKLFSKSLCSNPHKAPPDSLTSQHQTVLPSVFFPSLKWANKSNTIWLKVCPSGFSWWISTIYVNI